MACIHVKVPRMFISVRFRVVSVLWLLIPTLLWSAILHNLILCIDPFVFPTIEKRIPAKLVPVFRGIWVLAFAVVMLMVWNVSPATYLFYLREALPFAPRLIWIILAISSGALVWFMLWRDDSHSLEAANKWFIRASVILLLMKGLPGGENGCVDFFKQHFKSQVLTNIQLIFVGAKAGAAHAVRETPERTFDSYVRHAPGLAPAVILMVVESWGEQVAGLNDMAGEIAAQGFHVLEQGFTTYRGATLSGEIRELCARYIQPSNSLIDDMHNLKCAPQYLKEKGYDVFGVYGYNKTFYAESVFWHRFGFENQTFAEDLPVLPQCPGPFAATCDKDLIAYGMDKLDAARDPAFLYMLTLSSHEPLDAASLHVHGRYFNDVPVAHRTQILTRYAISNLIERLQQRKDKACTLVYVAGDHQPPSASAAGGIFERDKVPYLVFSTNCRAGKSP